MASTPAGGAQLLSADPGEKAGQKVSVLCSFPAPQRNEFNVSMSPDPFTGHVNFGLLVFIFSLRYLGTMAN